MQRPRLAHGASAGCVALIAGMLPATPAVAANAVFQAGTLNIFNGLSHADFVHDLELITSRADLVGLNEVNGRKAFLQNWATANGWWLYAPEPSQAAHEALLAKKSGVVANFAVEL